MRNQPDLFQFRFKTLCCLLVVLSTLPFASAQTVPFGFDTRQIVVQVSLNGQTFAMMVDTGAPLSMLNKKMAERLKLITGGDVSVEGLGGKTKGELGFVRGMTLGEVSLKPMFMVVTDISAMQEAFGDEIQGILGYDFLQQYETTIDYAKRQLTLAPPVDKLEGGVNFTMKGCMPRIKASANGESFDADIDTGASGTTLPIVISSRLKLGHDRIGKGVGLTGQTYMRYAARLKTLSVGDAQASSVTVGYRAPLLYDQEELPTIGRLGNNFLQHFRLTLDYKAKQYKLEPTEEAVEDYEAIHPGLTLNVKKGHVFVERVLPDSPAAQAGVRDGDELLKIDGAPIYGFSIYRIVHLLEGPEDSEVTLTVRHQESERICKAKRVNWLP